MGIWWSITTLSTHIWKLADEEKDFNISWSDIEKAPEFNPATRKCRICLKEKFTSLQGQPKRESQAKYCYVNKLYYMHHKTRQPKCFLQPLLPCYQLGLSDVTVFGMSE